MKMIGSILLAVGFLAGTYTAVSHEKSVNWTEYGICAGIMIAGMITLGMSRVSEAAQAGEKHDQDMDTLETSIASLVDKVRNFQNAPGDEDQLTIYTRIDDELMEDLHNFVEARESMIPRLGMQTYANIMSPFATGERLLNRAWSASADGYVDEVRDCVAGARAELERAKQLLEQART